MDIAIPLLIALVLDWTLGDPAWLPHPVVGFGRMIAFGERHLNKGSHRKLKGGLMAGCLIVLVFTVTWLLCCVLDTLLPTPSSQYLTGSLPLLAFNTIIIFFCLAGTTLIREVRQVFLALDRSLDEGRRQVARIVGRDTMELSAQEVRTAALETLAENLSDGVIAPLFWMVLLGVPGMLAYKMVNTLDSMIGYRTERYRDFGCVAARMDDVANYVPARLTALLMVLGFKVLRLFGSCPAGKQSPGDGRTSSQGPTLHGILRFVWRNGRNHASPNSGYPEAALAGVLNCRFGGPHYYFGELFDKPYIGENERELSTADMLTAVRVNRMAEVLMVSLCLALGCLTENGYLHMLL